MKFRIQHRRLMLITTLTLLTIGCTVVKHGEEEKSPNQEITFYFQDGSFDAASFVDDIWESKVVPAFADGSYFVTEVLAAIDYSLEAAGEAYGKKAEIDSPYSFRVTGTAQIKSEQTESAASTVELSIDGYDGQTTVLMQIGPVIKTSAVRDSLEFISFGDFTNQLEYAGVSKELNFTVRDKVVSVLDRDNLLGTNIKFSGAFIAFPNKPILLTPVIIKVGGSDG